MATTPQPYSGSKSMQDWGKVEISVEMQNISYTSTDLGENGGNPKYAENSIRESLLIVMSFIRSSSFQTA